MDALSTFENVRYAEPGEFSRRFFTFFVLKIENNRKTEI
jgi:hypothetical protein